ncbi:hypothetical protein V8J36_08925 [Frigidibacter sp. MR17.14]|uniref:hypothetical protein n=1 Tax=Frigidibacter sp. MR17.14 TaxID=3126509 RepID=UPI003012E39F
MSLLRKAAFAALVLAPAALPGLALANTGCQGGSAEALMRDHCKLTLATISPDDAKPAASLGPKRIVVPASQKHLPAFQIGDDFPVYKHNILMDPPRYGLPAVNGNWRYYRVEGDTYRVDAASLKVIEVVDTSANRLLR